MDGTDTSQFYYQSADGKECGPVSLDELAVLQAARQVRAFTKVRPADSMVWRAAVDMAELASVFYPFPSSSDAAAVGKPLAQVTAAELPSVITYLVKRFANWIFFLLVYLPVSAWIVGALWSLWSAYYNFSQVMNLLPTTPSFSLHFAAQAVVLLLGCIAPLIVWICFRKKKLNFRRFVISEFAAYGAWFAIIVVGSVLVEKGAMDQFVQQMPSVFRPFW
jgi:hypothetical protein